ncbi:hypothetical protein K505DRAFT_420052 [Melanomma pulvis-pyrius CBS 109.77]|uniref:DUF7924 domain-containing protein n=1 Tax=Melanomma pulvis-pyrius CBS 109.77 TaxID=1314802 RepID=A0A6A6X196_9PLEO|nr:hypothetical protein K505DRAFT_420052 [Melanomma pulvis-pyrius CBS 109.77]
MKRALESCAPGSKRQKTSADAGDAGDAARRTSSPRRPRDALSTPPSSFSASPVHLTHETLSTVPPRAQSCVQSITEWAAVCEPTEPAGDPVPLDNAIPTPTGDMPPSNAAMARRQNKEGTRARSRSPDKGGLSYRNTIMKEARVVVEAGEAPPHISARVQRILAMELDDDRKDRVEGIARSYTARCTQLLRENQSGEALWRAALSEHLVEPLSKLWPGSLTSNAGEKPWRKDLVPSSPDPNEFLWPDTAPNPNPLFPSGPVFSSDSVSTTSTSLLFGMTIPKPDMTLGLADSGFSTSYSWLLRQMEMKGITSDPHQLPMSLRLPFLVMEAKGITSGLFGAQNQAAGAGASALTLLDRFHTSVSAYFAPRESATSPGSGIHVQDAEADTDNPLSTLVFSLTTEGPVHELWVHYRRGDEFHMACVDIWRPALSSHASSMLGVLARVVAWGATTFQKRVEVLLGQMVEQMGKHGVLAEFT